MMEIVVILIVLSLIVGVGPFITYILVGWGAHAYFEEKLKYHQKLFKTIEGDKEHG